MSHAFPDTADTRLGRYLSKQEPHPGERSGFRLISNSIEALAVRLLLADRAERSLDVQYYMINNDVIGRVFISSLILAADRGVRVRLLIDDISTSGMDKGFAAIADHPNIELRLFNPFASRGFRVFDIWDIKRLNRRMHNKSFTVDNQFTIIGGRNIATEYFAANEGYNFGDLDTLAVGPIVQDTSNMFDQYWNHRKAIPFEQISRQKPDDGARMAQLRSVLKASAEEIGSSPYAAAVKASFDGYINATDEHMTWAPYQLVYDSPDKVIADKAPQASKITTPLLQTVLGAEQSLLVISPYFVPRKAGIAKLAELQNSGVQVDILTNSLASSDHVLVHGGYGPSRKPLLQQGLHFFEAREDIRLGIAESHRTEKASSALHTKAFIVDERYFFMGSFNWDPRSANLNTELGIIIDSPLLAAGVAANIYKVLPQLSYEVFLNQDNELRWRTFDQDGVEKVFTTEPNTGYWKRLRANLSKLLPIKSQL